MNEKLSILVSSCDAYFDTWHPFFTLLKKYWKNIESYPIYLCTESKKFSFSGLNIICPLNIHRESKWSENLIKILKYINSEYVLFMLDDFWLQSPVRVDVIENCINYLDSDSNIGFICLIYQKRGPKYESQYYELLKRGKHVPFRITTQAGIWRRKYLLKILRKHESAWEFETRATWRSKFYKEDIYVLKKEERNVFVYPVGGVLWGGKYLKEHVDSYQDESIELNLLRDIRNKNDITTNNLNRRTLKYMVSIIKSIMPKW